MRWYLVQAHTNKSPNFTNKTNKNNPLTAPVLKHFCFDAQFVLFFLLWRHYWTSESFHKPREVSVTERQIKWLTIYLPNLLPLTQCHFTSQVSWATWKMLPYAHPSALREKNFCLIIAEWNHRNEMGEKIERKAKHATKAKGKIIFRFFIAASWATKDEFSPLERIIFNVSLRDILPRQQS